MYPGNLISALLHMWLSFLGLKMLLPTPLPTFPSGEAWPKCCVHRLLSHCIGPNVARPPVKLGSMAHCWAPMCPVKPGVPSLNEK